MMENYFRDFWYLMLTFSLVCIMKQLGPALAMHSTETSVTKASTAQIIDKWILFLKQEFHLQSLMLLSYCQLIDGWNALH